MKEADTRGQERSIAISGKPGFLLQTWLLAAVLEGFVSLLLFYRIPGASEDAWLGGFSKVRLLILLGLIGSLFFLLFLTYRTWRFPSWLNLVTGKIRDFFQSRFSYGVGVGLSLVGVVITSQTLYFSSVVGDPYIQGYLLRIRPFLFWLLGLSVQTLIMLPLFRYDFQGYGKVFRDKVLWLSGIIFTGLILMGILIVVTGSGIEPDIVGWDGPGTPVQIIQVGLVWAAGTVFLIVETWSQKWKNGYQRRLDLLVSVLLWGFAFVLWSQEPLTADYFAPAPRAPNYEVYPYSDAALHDVNSQELLVGEGFPGISRKPLYVLFLAILHNLGGQSYMDVIKWQVSVLAILPVLIYWLTKSLHTRASGLIAAGLVVLRERNAISLSGEIRVSHSKLMMSDMPAVLAVVLLTWLLVIWLKEPVKKQMLPIWIGGVVGLLLLLRPQFSLLIPFIFLMVLLILIRKPLFGIISIFKITLGLILTLSPWLWRSYQISGALTLNDPKQMAFLTEQYHMEPQTESLQLLPGESVSAFNNRINRYLKDFVVQNPRYVTGFISDHFIHNEIEMIQALPMSLWIVNNPDSDLFPHWRQNFEKLWNDCCSLRAYVEANQFWDPWLERIQSVHLFPVLLNLALISIGLAAVWHHGGILGLFPLGIGLAYSLSTAVGRYSGWRLILPADWVVILYFAIGISQGMIWLLRYYHHIPRISDENDVESSPIQDLKDLLPPLKSSIVKAITVSLVLFGIGLIPLIIEAAVPTRYQSQFSVSDLASEFPQFSEDELQEFLQKEGGNVANGRALYPRYYRTGEGEPGESWAAFLVRDFPRLGFFMVGPFKGSVILPIDKPPDWFPNASDVIILGCNQDTYLDAAAIKISHSESVDGLMIQRESLEGLQCPLNTP